jgi:hypothetical protein
VFWVQRKNIFHCAHKEGIQKVPGVPPVTLISALNYKNIYSAFYPADYTPRENTKFTHWVNWIGCVTPTKSIPTRQAIYARSRNHCCRGKAISITYLWLCMRPWMRACACVRGGCSGAWASACARTCSLAYPACIAYATCFIILCALFGCTRLFDIISWRRHFRKNVTEHKMCILIFSTAFIQNTSHSKKNSARYCHKC